MKHSRSILFNKVICPVFVLLLCYCSTKKESKPVSSTAPLHAVEDTMADPDGTAKNGTQTAFEYDTVLSHACQHDNLSKVFDIKVKISRFRNTAEKHDSSAVKLFIVHKKTKEIMDSLLISSHFYFEHFFMNCKNVRSYSTKANISTQAVDNYYGDIVVADFNFDKKDDLAVINDYGGNGGSFYSYFIQDAQRKFVRDQYLTDSMTYFPSEINSTNKTLKTYVVAGVCGLGEHIYQLDQKSNHWSEKSHRIINVCNENK